MTCDEQLSRMLFPLKDEKVTWKKTWLLQDFDSLLIWLPRIQIESALGTYSILESEESGYNIISEIGNFDIYKIL